MTGPRIIVIGASAGGVEALQALVGGLPANFPAAVLVVLHVAPYSPSALPAILSRAGALPARHPRDGEALEAGQIYVAPPDCHLLLDGERVAVKKGPKENRSRPAVDALFRSAAYTHGEGVIGVVLSGLLDDGTSGLWTIKRLGGTAVVQQPEDAQYDSMPRSALQHVDVDHVLPAEELGELLTRLVQEPTPHLPGADLDGRQRERLGVEVGVAAQNSAYQLGIVELGELSPLTCPECHGVLVRVEEGTLTRYRCHTGHGYTADTLLAEITESVEEKSYQVLRALEESAMLLRDLSGRFEQEGDRGTGQAFLEQAHEAERRTRTIREVIFRTEQLSEAKVRQAVPHGEGSSGF